MIKFPSINQYRNTVKAVRETAEYHNEQPPVISYHGTVKLHGTNAAIVRHNERVSFQSRNRVLNIGDDNSGFAARMSEIPNSLEKLLDSAGGQLSDVVAIFGEWCGQGIQNGVGITELPKMFVIFAVSVNHEWIDLSDIKSLPDDLIFKITDFATFSIDIDFESPELSQSALGEITQSVEDECPVAKQLGVTGIGEGVVWRPVDLELQDSKYWFKVKGEKHSVSKVKTLAPVDVEMIKRRDDLVASLVTENRLEQGVYHLSNELNLDIEMENMGEFLRWVFGDIAKEESDTIEANGFTVKELGKPISSVAKRHFIAATQRIAA